jgi:Flp pilus assembly CpaE family ATPase
VSQRVFVIVGGKGGVGATTIAIKLVQRFPAPRERMIVDADFSGKRSLAVWYDLSNALDVARVIGSANVVQAHAGPLVMELARTYEDGLIVKAEAVIRALAALSDDALIVVDAPQPFAATIRPLMVRATKVVVVTESSVLGVRATRSVLDAMARSGISRARLMLVQSDIGGRTTLARREVEAALGYPIDVELANERDRRFDALFDGFVTRLAALPPLFRHPDMPVEKPVFDRRIESDSMPA